MQETGDPLSGRSRAMCKILRRMKLSFAGAEVSLHLAATTAFPCVPAQSRAMSSDSSKPATASGSVPRSSRLDGSQGGRSSTVCNVEKLSLAQSSDDLDHVDSIAAAIETARSQSSSK